MSSITEIAQFSLRQNIIPTSQGSFLAAGAHQFKTLWVRDFCYSIKGLLKLGEHELVKNQLLLFLKHQGSNGLLPRGMDVTDPKLRVVCSTFNVGLRALNYKNRDLKAEYLGEHQTPAVDSNLLVLLGIFDWTKATNDTFFFDGYLEHMKSAFDFSVSLKKHDLLLQPAFSDWQDSANRSGEGFYLNLLYYKVLLQLKAAQLHWFTEDLTDFEALLFQTFFDQDVGLFREKAQTKQFSLESQLWCIEEQLFASLCSSDKLWSNLKASPLWKPLPGHPVWPNYKSSEISWTTKVVGLRHYHDTLYWSWLLAESLKVSRSRGDATEVTRLTKLIADALSSSNTVHEIYSLKKGQLRPFQSLLYSSEAPFSWGAAKLLEALA